MKTLGAESAMGVPGQTHSTRVSAFPLLRKEHAPCPLTGGSGDGLQKPVHRFLLTPPASFSLGDPTVCPFAVINLSLRYNSVLRPVSPSESPNVAAASGTPDTGEPKRKMGTKWKSNKNCLHPKQESVCAILMGYLGYK